MLIVDTGPILSQFEADAAIAAAMQRFLSAERDVPILPQSVAAELDYMIMARCGHHASAVFLQDLAAGRFQVPCLEPADFATVNALNERYRDLGVGLADLSVVVLAARYRTRRILTFDQRHFRTLRPLQGGTFTLVPFDERIPPKSGT